MIGVIIGGVDALLAYVAGAVVAVWGVAHVVPTRPVLAGFEPITAENRRIVLQEWLAEAFTTWGIAAVVVAVTAAGGANAAARWWVYRVAAGLLVGVVPLRRLLPPGTLAARPGLPVTVLARGLLTFAFFGADTYVPLAITAVRHQSTAVASVAGGGGCG